MKKKNTKTLSFAEEAILIRFTDEPRMALYKIFKIRNEASEGLKKDPDFGTDCLKLLNDLTEFMYQVATKEDLVEYFKMVRKPF